MPMIDFRYQPDTISTSQAQSLAFMLQADLRTVIRQLRPEKGDAYGVTVAGDPFGPVTLFQPALLIHVFYHEDWEFTGEELPKLAAYMRIRLDSRLADLNLVELKSKIRFYRRSGYAGS